MGHPPFDVYLAVPRREKVIRAGLLGVILATPMSTTDRFLFLAMGLLAFWFARRGISTGEVPLQFFTLKRSSGELPFWFGVAVNVLVGTLCLLEFIFGRDVWK
jgi:hypothetical protein